jgi:hypothetical protein
VERSSLSTPSATALVNFLNQDGDVDNDQVTFPPFPGALPRSKEVIFALIFVILVYSEGF